jgi:hypothetical protein
VATGKQKPLPAAPCFLCFLHPIQTLSATSLPPSRRVAVDPITGKVTSLDASLDELESTLSQRILRRARRCVCA